MMRSHDAPAPAFATWPESHWRATAVAAPFAALEGEARAEVAVIGAGYGGVSAALALAEAGVDTVLLEAAQPGWGASGRNGGFCCKGGAMLSDAALVKRFGEVQARAFLRFQEAAVAHVAWALKSYGIDAEAGPEGELCLAHSPRAWAALQGAVQVRAALTGAAPRLIPRDALRAEGLAARGVFGAALDPVGFPLHPMKYALRLAEAARRAGVRIHGDSAVTAMSPEAAGWRLATARGVVRARRVLVATNGYGTAALPRWLARRALPVGSTVLTTRPLSEAEIAEQGWTSARMAYDSRRLLHYFRLLPDRRFLFGMRGGLSAEPRDEARAAARARRHFQAMFPAWAGVETEAAWSGLVCLTGSRRPYAGPVPGREGLFAVFGWHGNGVAGASYAGHLLGRALAGAGLDLPAPLVTPPRRLPPLALRRPLIGAAYAWYGLRDGPMRRAQTP